MSTNKEWPHHIAQRLLPDHLTHCYLQLQFYSLERMVHSITMGDTNIAVSDEPLPSNLAQFRRMTPARMVNPTTETENDVRSHLVEAYMSGQPLFTKKNIRYAWEQTQRRPGHGGKVYSKDIKGNTVEYTVDFTGSGIPDNCNCGDCEDNHNTVVKW